MQLAFGPPTESGFFYDSYTGSDMFREDNYVEIEKGIEEVVKQKQKFVILL